MKGGDSCLITDLSMYNDYICLFFSYFYTYYYYYYYALVIKPEIRSLQNLNSQSDYLNLLRIQG